MSTRQYSPDKVELSWYGLDLKEGIAQGTFIQEARNAPSWTHKPNGTGGIVRVYNPDRSGTLTLTVDQESKLHQQLGLLARTDRISRNLVAPFNLYDTTSKERFIYTNAFIASEPDEARATESQTFQWVFIFESKEKDMPADDSNVVGN